MYSCQSNSSNNSMHPMQSTWSSLTAHPPRQILYMPHGSACILRSSVWCDIHSVTGEGGGGDSGGGEGGGEGGGGDSGGGEGGEKIPTKTSSNIDEFNLRDNISIHLRFDRCRGDQSTHPTYYSRSVGMQSSNELEKLLAKIEELEAQIPVSTDPAERTAMRNVLVAMLQ